MKRHTLLLIFLILFLIPAVAMGDVKEAWNTDADGVRRYYDEKGYPANGATIVYEDNYINGNRYYFVDGVPQTGWIKGSSGKAYYDKNGLGAEGWCLIDGRWYYFNWYSGAAVIVNFNAEGIADSDSIGWVSIDGKKGFTDPATNENSDNYSSYGTRTVKINGKKYMFDTDHIMVYGWQKNYKGYPVYCDEDGGIAEGFREIDGKTYYFEPGTGIMTLGEKWLTVDGESEKYMFDNNGVLISINDEPVNGSSAEKQATVYKEEWATGTDGVRRYYDENGYPANGATIVYEDNYINGNRYYFVDGVPQTGWIKGSSGKAYYDKNGLGAEGWCLIDGRWYYFNWYSGAAVIVDFNAEGTADSDSVGWVSIDGKKGFTDPATNENSDNYSSYGTRTVKINGKKYMFDTDHIMVYGWQKNYKGYPVYCDEDGGIEEGFREIDGKTYYFEPGTGIMTLGEKWITVDGESKSYIFDENGVLISINGESVDIGELPSNKDGLVQDEDGEWRYYENGEFVSDKMGLVEYGDDLVYIADGQWATKLNGLWDDSGHWYLFDGGVVQKDYNGLYQDTDKSWWLIRNGMADFSYDGLYCDQNIGWVLLFNGRSVADYTGLYYDQQVGWWLIRNGQIAFDYTGLWNDSTFGWWLISSGRLCNEYNGLWYDQNYGWWLINDGTIDFGYTGLYNDPACGWWLIANGQICFDYVGLWNDPNYGWWLIDHGALASYYTGLWNDPQYGWWLIGGGHLCDDYNGLWEDPNVGWWLINGGSIAWGYNGPYDEFGATWNIVNGQLFF